MNLKQHVESLELEYGETYRGDCPVCNGKKTFTATCTETGVLYNCYKAGCGTGGSVATNLTSAQLQAVFRKRIQSDTVEKPKPIAVPDGFTRRLPNRRTADWLKQWHLDIEKHNLYYDVRQDRVCFSVRSDGMTVDYVGRSMYNRTPKWLRYASAHVPYMYGKGKCAVLVEDCVSAVAAGELPTCTGVALLGTNVLEEYIPYLTGFDSVIVALDPDARSKTLKLTSELRSRFDKVYAFNSRDDLKYRDATDLQNLKVMSER